MLEPDRRRVQKTAPTGLCSGEQRLGPLDLCQTGKLASQAKAPGAEKKASCPERPRICSNLLACAMPRRWEPAKSCLSLVMTELGDLGGQSTQPSRAKQSRGLPLAVDAKLRAPDRCESSPPGDAGAPEHGRGGAWRWHPLVKKRKRGVVTPG